LRDPNGPQVTFAFEGFIDELAAAAKADPVQFRLEMLEASAEDNVFRKARSLAVVQIPATLDEFYHLQSFADQAASLRNTY